MSASFSRLVGQDLSIYFDRRISEFSRFDRAKLFLRAFLDVDFRVVFYVRIMQWYLQKGFKKLAILTHFRLKSRYSVDISPWAEIGGGLRLLHGFDIVVGAGARLGPGARLFNGVSLGNIRPDRRGEAMPEVGAFCILGAGAKILGSIRVGDGVLIGANAVITRDLVPGTRDFDDLAESRKIRLVDADYRSRMSGLIA